MANDTTEQKYREFLNTTRFYKKKLPDKDEYVKAYVKEFQEVGIYCYLNEYKLCAFMSYKDASSSKKLRNIKKEITKNKNYILITSSVDYEKNFIDVEKRSIDKKDESEYNSLIVFYQKVFNIFLKTFVFHDPLCNQEELYDFLENTLWKEDPKLIKKNMLNLHVDLEDVIKKYNLIGTIGNNIVNSLKDIIPCPKHKYEITLKINSLSINASSDIKENLMNLNNKINGEFMVDSAPIYKCSIVKEYCKDFLPSVYLTKIKNSLKEYIQNITSNDFFIHIVDVNYEVTY